MTIALVFMTAALSMVEIEAGPVRIGCSSLLTCMMLGTVFCNICDVSEELMDRTERWTAPLYILFFVFSGAELDFNVIADAAIIGVGLIYIFSRSAGKYFGAGWSARFSGCSDTIV